MRTNRIPNTNIEASVLCMGTGSYGGSLDQAMSFRLLDTFVDQGGNFFDSAKVYSDWIPGERSRSEKLLGEWMQKRKNRGGVVMATKGAHPDLSTMHIQRLSPQEIRNDLEASLRHLQSDYIDLYWLHRDDPTRPVEEIVRTLAEQVQAGKIRAFGCSNWKLDRLKSAQEFTAKNNLPAFSGVQNLWNLACVNSEALFDPTMVVMDEAYRQYHAESQLAAIPYTSQANGLFQKLESGGVAALSDGLSATYINPETVQRFERMKALKTGSGMNTTQIILGYLLSQPFPTYPVFSCRSIEQLEDTLSAAEVNLLPEQLAFLES